MHMYIYYIIHILDEYMYVINKYIYVYIIYK